MSREVVFLRGVEADLQAAFNRYEDKVEGLGEEFVLTIDGSLAAIGQFPEIARLDHKTIRRLLVSRFPYGIFYAVRRNHGEAFLTQPGGDTRCFGVLSPEPRRDRRLPHRGTRGAGEGARANFGGVSELRLHLDEDAEAHA